MDSDKTNQEGPNATVLQNVAGQSPTKQPTSPSKLTVAGENVLVHSPTKTPASPSKVISSPSKASEGATTSPVKVVQTSNSPLADSNFASYVNNEEEAANSEISGQESSSVLDITNSWKIDIRNLDGNNSGTTNSSEQQPKDINVLLEETADSSTPPASDDTVYYSHPDKRGLSKMGQFFLFLICGFLIWITVAVALPHSAPANSITELKLPDPRNANVPNEMGEDYTNGYFPRGFKDYCGKNNNKFTIQPLSGDERNVVSELAQVGAVVGYLHLVLGVFVLAEEVQASRRALEGLSLLHHRRHGLFVLLLIARGAEESLGLWVVEAEVVRVGVILGGLGLPVGLVELHHLQRGFLIGEG